jgi:hypothetical protein
LSRKIINASEDETITARSMGLESFEKKNERED